MRIPIGTLVKGAEAPATTIRTLARAGFETFSPMFWETLGDLDLPACAAEVSAVAEETGTTISALSIYGNPLRGDETGDRTLDGMAALLEAAPAFGCTLVSGFAGRVPGSSVPDSIAPWVSAFAPLVERAEALGVSLAFENCRLGDTWKTGKWNIAINGDAWERMFAALPSRRLGLEWEPCHQVEALVDPLAQAADWADRIFHVHGKDARVDRTALARHGLYGEVKWYSSCFPGNGDTDWRRIFHLLSARGYQGAVDVEGWNDADWCGDRELEGQYRALNYLRTCRESTPIG